MPHYYFHLFGDEDGGRIDEQGVFFPDLDQAYLDVHRAILDMSFDMLRRRRDPFGLRFEIADKGGTVLMDVPFLEVLRPDRGTVAALSREFRRSVAFEIRRSRVLNADLSQQIANAHDTIRQTKKLLSRSRLATG